jgi:hypothetical protein
MSNQEYGKKYYAEHADKIKARMNEKVDCPNCAKDITRCNLQKHMRTAKCKATKNMKDNGNSSKLINEFLYLKNLLHHNQGIENKDIIKTRLDTIYDELHNM